MQFLNSLSLQYVDGAALFYTTVKDKRTYEKFYKYLVHKLYSYPFNIPASVVDRESILM